MYRVPGVRKKKLLEVFEKASVDDVISINARKDTNEAY